MAELAAGKLNSPRDGFGGFSRSSIEKSAELKDRLYSRRLSQMEDTINNMIERMEEMEKFKTTVQRQMEEVKVELLGIRLENEELKNENESLKKQIKSEVSEVKKQKEEIKLKVKTVEKTQTEWKKQQETTEQSLKKIIDEQKKEKKELRDEVINVIKQEKRLVRDTVEKVKCLVIFGIPEEKILNKMEREEKEKEKVKKVLVAASEDEGITGIKVEDIFRIGKFEENKNRPVRIKFATQSMAEEILYGSWRLAGKEELKNVWINKDLDEGERLKVRELVEEAKQKNDSRTEEEKLKFYWKVRDWQVRKRFYKK